LTYQITSARWPSVTRSLAAEPRGWRRRGKLRNRQGTLALNSNYSLSFIGADLTINARAITVTADAKSKTYGDADRR
jgi:hypothetical protein